MFLKTIAILVCMLAVWPINSLPADDSAGDQFFESKIRPLLFGRCVECHGDSEPDGELSLTSREGLLRGGTLGPALVPGKPKESLLIGAINHDAFLKMPPKDKLATSDLALLTKWVAMGAPWPSANSTNDNSTNDKSANSKTDLMQVDAAINTASDTKVDQVEFTEQQKTFWSYQPLA